MFGKVLKIIGICVGIFTIWIWAGSSTEGLAQLIVDFFTDIYTFVASLAKGVVNALKNI